MRAVGNRNRNATLGVRPAALAFGAEVIADRTGAADRKWMAPAARAAPESRAAAFGDLHDQAARGATGPAGMALAAVAMTERQ